jgi:hypothetical protein
MRKLDECYGNLKIVWEIAVRISNTISFVLVKSRTVNGDRIGDSMVSL